MIDFDKLDQEVIGWMSKGETSKLYALAMEAPTNKAVELGSFCGKSAIAIGSAIKERAGSLICMDWFGKKIGHTDYATKKFTLVEDSWVSFQENIKKYELSDVINPIKGNFRQVLPMMEGQFGFIFIDANHTMDNVLQDAMWAKAHLVPGGTIAFHDYGNTIHVDVKPVVDMLKTVWKGTWEHHYLLAIYKAS